MLNYSVGIWKRCEKWRNSRKICVFTYNDETYIKQLEIDNKNLIHLVSFNQDISDIIIWNEKELKCEGRVVNTY